MDDISIRLEQLDLSYGKEKIIGDLSLTLNKNEILCIVGESGSGKSTLLKAILGVDESLRVEKGSIWLEGRELTRLSVRERRRLCGNSIGMIFQNPGASFNPIRRFDKQFIETLKSQQCYDRETFYADVTETLQKLGIEDTERILQSYPYEMSGGMNQRIALALLLLLRPRLLLADEPTSALDVVAQNQVMTALACLKEKIGLTEIMVTHNLGLAARIADKIGIMYAGRLVEYGAADQVLKNPAHPYTKGLLRAIPSRDGRMPVGLDGQPSLFGASITGCSFFDRCICRHPACLKKAYQMINLGYDHSSCCVEE